MSGVNIGAVLVTEDEKVVGIFTERDYARKGELQERIANNTPFKDLMTEN
jgi:CBS domain-containing protein